MNEYVLTREEARSYMDITQPAQALYWTVKLKITGLELTDAVRRVGNSVAAVYKHVGDRRP